VTTRRHPGSRGRGRPVRGRRADPAPAPDGHAPRPLDDAARAARAAANTGEPTVEFADATPYEEYVGVRQLTALVRPVTDHPAEPSFLVVTQVMELWFLLLRREWELAQARLRVDDLDGALAAVRRSVHHLRSLDAAWGSLLWLTPAEFEGFRDQLGEASGFQSYGYRHVEFLLGLKAESVVRPHSGQPAVHADLLRALGGPSLEDDVLAYLARRGLPVPAGCSGATARSPTTQTRRSPRSGRTCTATHGPATTCSSSVRRSPTWPRCSPPGGSGTSPRCAGRWVPNRAAAGRPGWPGWSAAPRGRCSPTCGRRAPSCDPSAG
jgi:tryptophan 2,3-dioxygenase